MDDFGSEARFWHFGGVIETDGKNITVSLIRQFLEQIDAPAGIISTTASGGSLKMGR